ncbi:hypothetical protein, partial [uncultured Desulfovibrio sp.]|uniref:hypothetical protein n=1 Tax=uncultured Desulfovibrio sp. TaxID=167968 RepID=UPI002633F2E2
SLLGMVYQKSPVLVCTMLNDKLMEVLKTLLRDDCPAPPGDIIAGNTLFQADPATKPYRRPGS